MPKLPPRCHVLMVRCDDPEAEAIRGAAARAGKTVAGWMRELCVNAAQLSEQLQKVKRSHDREGRAAAAALRKGRP